MAIFPTKIHDEYNASNHMEFVMDQDSDVSLLPGLETCAPGSKATSIESGNEFYLTTFGFWTKSTKALVDVSGGASTLFVDVDFNTRETSVSFEEALSAIHSGRDVVLRRTYNGEYFYYYCVSASSTFLGFCASYHNSADVVSWAKNFIYKSNYFRGTYSKPGGGIPETDLSAVVREKLQKASITSITDVDQVNNGHITFSKSDGTSESVDIIAIESIEGNDGVRNLKYLRGSSYSYATIPAVKKVQFVVNEEMLNLLGRIINESYTSSGSIISYYMTKPAYTVDLISRVSEVLSNGLVPSLGNLVFNSYINDLDNNNTQGLNFKWKISYNGFVDVSVDLLYDGIIRVSAVHHPLGNEIETGKHTISQTSSEIKNSITSLGSSKLYSELVSAEVPYSLIVPAVDTGYGDFNIRVDGVNNITDSYLDFYGTVEFEDIDYYVSCSVDTTSDAVNASVSLM